MAKLSFRINLGRFACASVTFTVDSLFIICIIHQFADAVKLDGGISTPRENPSARALQKSFVPWCADEQTTARARAASPAARRNSSVPSTVHSAAGRRFHRRRADG